MIFLENKISYLILSSLVLSFMLIAYVDFYKKNRLYRKFLSKNRLCPT